MSVLNCALILYLFQFHKGTIRTLQEQFKAELANISIP